MNTKSVERTSVAPLLAITVLAALAVGGCDKRAPKGSAASSSVTAETLVDKIEQARTPREHQALAQYYDEQARVMRRELDSERDAQQRYERRWSPDSHSMGRSARDHYSRMIEDRQDSATRYESMSEWHREMAMRAERSPGADE